jgi:hypothetical protein
MTRTSQSVTRRFAWGTALAFCGGLIGLKAADTSPVDFISGLIAGAATGLVVAACIDVAGDLLAHILSNQTLHLLAKLKTITTIAISIVAALIWIRVIKLLLLASTNQPP